MKSLLFNWRDMCLSTQLQHNVTCAVIWLDEFGSRNRGKLYG